ncbi:MAG: SDR family NAD(P)-dependent oxidoreductase [Bacteroidales bacterium]
MKRIIIIGATSGIGLEVAKLYVAKGWKVGVAGRRNDALLEFQTIAPSQIEIQALDITNADASDKLQELIEKMGGADLFLLSSGIGYQNPALDPTIELNTAETNVTGFIRMINTIYHFFKQQNRGHIAVISSIAGTKGLGIAPAYSATKRFQNHYIESLSQLANMTKANIRFTDIRPGFVATAILKDRSYPLLMTPEQVAQCVVSALEQQKKVVIIDWRYAILVFFWRLIPRSLWIKLKVKN